MAKRVIKSFTLDPELVAEVTAIARRENRPVSRQIENVLRRGLAVSASES